jgi:hypothetical protein
MLRAYLFKERLQADLPSKEFSLKSKAVYTVIIFPIALR